MVEFRARLHDLKESLISAILAFMKEKNLDRVEMVEGGDSPVFGSETGSDEDTFTVDRLFLGKSEDDGREWLVVEASSWWENSDWYGDDLPVETLLAIYEWIVENVEDV